MTFRFTSCKNTINTTNSIAGVLCIAVDLNDDIAYVANEESNFVSLINDNTLSVTNVNVGIRPVSIAVDDFDDIAYVANNYPHIVSVINGKLWKV